MKRIFQILLTMSIINCQLSISSAQVGINNDNSEPDASAMLDVKSSDKGVLIPRMSSTDRQQILDPAIGLMVYDSTAQAFYYFNGLGWLELLSGSVTFLEDSDQDTKIQVEESPDEDMIRFDVAGQEAMQIDSVGNVGIGVIPDNQLSVKMIGVNGTYTLTANTNVNTGGISSSEPASAGQGWQSFTATTTGQLDSIFLEGRFSSSNPTDIRIYEGEGTSGTLLYEAFGIAFEEFMTSGPRPTLITAGDLEIPIAGNVQLIQNQQYTMDLTEASGWLIRLADNYPDGISSRNAGRDFLLEAFASVLADTLLFEVRDTVVQIGEYSLTNRDGEADQVLSTDGNGTVNWRSITDRDKQSLSFDTSNNNLSITDGNTVDLSSIDTDTDDQILSFNTSNNNLSIADGNTVDLSSIDTNTDTDDQTLSFDINNNILSIVDGNSVDLSSIDTDTDTDDQSLSFNVNNNILSIADGNSVDLSSIDTDTDTDDQSLSFNVNNNILSIADGNSVDLSSIRISTLSDDDNDTKIQVEEGADDDDIIRFDLANQEKFIMTNRNLQMLNSGNSIYIGENAGLNDDYSNNQNIGIGFESLTSSTTGTQNIGIGYQSLKSLTVGQTSIAIGTEVLGKGDPFSSVGIGYQALLENLTGSSNVAIGFQALESNTDGDGNVAIGTNAMDTNTTGSDNTIIGDNADVGTNNLSNATAIGANAVVSQNNSLVLGNNANVGIGTSTPDEKLHVVGNTKIESGSLEVMGNTKIENGSLEVSGASSFGNIINTNGNWISGDGGGEGIRIETNGDVEIGASSLGYNQGLSVRKGVSGLQYVAVFENANTSSSNSTKYNGVSIVAGKTQNNGANSRMLSFRRPGGTLIGQVIQNNSSTVNYQTSSDRRLKQNIKPTIYTLEDLMKIEVCDYAYKDEPTQMETGFIAQQLHQVYPQVVTVGGKEERTNPWMLDYGRLTPLLVKAIQDQQKKIEQQQLKIEQLQAQNSRIEQLERQMTQLLSQSNTTSLQEQKIEEK